MSAGNRKRQSVEGMKLIGKKSPEASLVSLPNHINKSRRKGHELEKGHNHGLTGKCDHVQQTNMLTIAGARLGKELRPFIAMTACLLALAVGAMTQRAYAQRGSETSSSDKKSMSSQPSRDAFETEEAPAAPEDGRSVKPSRWFTRLGVVGVPYYSSTAISTNRQRVTGSTAKASNNLTLTFDLGYDITKNISASVMLGIPPKPHITGE